MKSIPLSPIPMDGSLPYCYHDRYAIGKLSIEEWPVGYLVYSGNIQNESRVLDVGSGKHNCDVRFLRSQNYDAVCYDDDGRSECAKRMPVGKFDLVTMNYFLEFSKGRTPRYLWNQKMVDFSLRYLKRNGILFISGGPDLGKLIEGIKWPDDISPVELDFDLPNARFSYLTVGKSEKRD